MDEIVRDMPFDPEWAIDEARKLGADEVEVYYEETRQSEIKVYEGKVESLSSARSRGVGIRTFIGDKMGFAFGSDLRGESLKSLIGESVANAGVATPDGFNGLPDPAASYPGMEPFVESISGVPVEEKVAFALELERRALSANSLIKRVPEANFSDGERKVALFNSRGFGRTYRSNVYVASVWLIAEKDGEMQSGSGYDFGRSFKALSLENIAREAVDEALGMLGGKPVRTGVFPVVFSPKVGAMLLSVIGRALTADAVQKGRSLFAGRLGRKVASPLVTIVDDSLLPEGLESSPFDGEGVPTSTKNVIEGGFLRSYLYDSYTARKDGVRSTGNASRSFRTTPEPAPSNLYLALGGSNPQEIIGSVSEGFYVMEVSGLSTGGADPVSGDFSLGASGRWIRNGELGQPVREVTIAGNIVTLLEEIRAIGNDRKFVPYGGCVGSPTLLVSGLTVSGH